MYVTNSNAEVTPQVFNFTADVRQVRNLIINGEPWFVAKDVCDCLGLSNPAESLKALDDDEKLTSEVLMSGQNRKAWMINESGLYNLIFRSNKPEAKTFRKWVTNELLPQVRRTGSYSAVLTDPSARWAPPLERGLSVHPQSDLEVLAYLKLYLRLGDVKAVAAQLEVSRHVVGRVKRGLVRSERIIKALVDRAAYNRQNPKGYRPEFVSEQLTLLKGGSHA